MAEQTEHPQPPSSPARQPVRFIPATFNPRFANLFAWYVRRLASKRFHAVRVAAGTADAFAAAGRADRPLLICLNHAGWWDPLVCLLAASLIPGRVHAAPMEATQLEKFGFFTRLGIFGIDPDDPRSLRAMLGHVGRVFAGSPRPTLWITPQGRFTDVREPVVLRPGAAAVAAAHVPAVVVMAVEYAFWTDGRPEVFLRFAPVPAPAEPSTAAWHRALEGAMAVNGAALAALVIARDASAFEPLLARAGSRINPAYDLILRLRGRSAEVAPREPVHQPSVQGSPTR
jgi:1-acyl-sn-glycerol-3-phosphate acyltransferase